MRRMKHFLNALAPALAVLILLLVVNPQPPLPIAPPAYGQGFFGGISQGTFLMQEISQTTGIDLTAVADNQILNVTEGGILHNFTFRTEVSVAGTPTVVVELTMDGTTRNLTLYTAANTFDAEWGQGTVLEGVGDGSAGNNWRRVLLHGPYQTSLDIDVNVTGAAATGTMEFFIHRSTQL